MSEIAVYTLQVTSLIPKQSREIKPSLFILKYFKRVVKNIRHTISNIFCYKTVDVSIILLV